MTSVLVAVGALLLITGLVVAVTLLLESGGRVRVPVEPELPPTPTRCHDADPPAAPERTGPGPVEIVIEGQVARDQLVAAVLAAYAAARLPEANRVAAWVTSAGWPPGHTGSAYRPGVNLRGRPAAVRQLLECDVEDRCWVALNDRVDVDRGLRTRPAICEVLQGVCALRAAVISGAPLDGADLEAADAALTSLRPSWRGTTVSGALEELRHAVRDGAESSDRVVVSVAEPVAPVDRLQSRGEVHQGTDEPVRATA